MIESDFIKDFMKDTTIQVRVTPWSSENKVFWKLWEKIYKIRIKAPAEWWKANKELVRYISSLIPDAYSIDLRLGGNNQNKILQLTKKEA